MVLVVDEDESYASIRRVCDRVGFVALHAKATEAMAHVQRSPAVIVTPWPARDALAWIAQLRHAAPHALIVVVGEPGDRIAHDAGADLVLGRPLDERALASALQPLRANPTKRRELLIVEPDAHLSVVMQRWSSLELDASVVTTGRRAIEALRTRKPDAVLAELRLPDMDAAELYAAIEHASPGLGARTLFMIGGIVDDKSQQFLDGIPGQWIHKPFDLARLRTALDALVD